jgi:hypothetical protein
LPYLPGSLPAAVEPLPAEPIDTVAQSLVFLEGAALPALHLSGLLDRLYWTLESERTIRGLLLFFRRSAGNLCAL